jgi:hypothetical protein
VRSVAVQVYRMGSGLSIEIWFIRALLKLSEHDQAFALLAQDAPFIINLRMFRQ